jgi:hypothetical protein
VILAEIEKLSGPVTALEKKPAGAACGLSHRDRPARQSERGLEACSLEGQR